MTRATASKHRHPSQFQLCTHLCRGRRCPVAVLPSCDVRGAQPRRHGCPVLFWYLRRGLRRPGVFRIPKGEGGVCFKQQLQGKRPARCGQCHSAHARSGWACAMPASHPSAGRAPHAAAGHPSAVIYRIPCLHALAGRLLAGGRVEAAAVRPPPSRAAGRRQLQLVGPHMSLLQGRPLHVIGGVRRQ